MLAWAEKTKDGYMLREPEVLLHEWSSIYGKKEPSAYACYSLDNVSVLENKLKLLKKYMGIESYLTGFSGGVRYVPVIRYNKVHMYLAPEDIQEAISYLEMKEVSSGSNVVIFPLENDSYIKDSRKIEESLVVYAAKGTWGRNGRSRSNEGDYQMIKNEDLKSSIDYSEGQKKAAHRVLVELSIFLGNMRKKSILWEDECRI
ncbi:MAG: hypothetical protein BHW39_03825 [Firmicutes bacterium CAG:552_39_19]|nr:MAG: hypothetical protein BHW39_03825 [Firmicutes bacterium CAG:552_39_19]